MLTRGKDHRQQGGALLDVLGAGAVLSVALLMYASGAPEGMKDAEALQLAWHHRQVAMAAMAHVGGNYRQYVNALGPGNVAGVATADFSSKLPGALIEGGRVRPNSRDNRPCVLVRHQAGQNFNGDTVPTGLLEVWVAEVGGSSLEGAMLNMAQAGAGSNTGRFYRNASNELVATGLEPAWNLTAAQASELLASTGAQACAPVAADWENRLVSRWVVNALGTDTSSVVFGEYLARNSTSGSAWTRTMDAPLWLGDKGGGSTASVDTLGALETAIANASCSANDVGKYRRTAISGEPARLLQCRRVSGLYQWTPLSGAVVGRTLRAGKVVLTRIESENGGCADTLLGTLARNSAGAPMVCMGKESNATSDKRWIRVGVPWAWVQAPRQLYNAAVAQGGHSYTYNLSDIPSVARMLQVYVEVTTPTGKGATVSVKRDASSAIELFTVEANPAGTAISGRPRLLDRGDSTTTYTFELDASADASTNLKVNLIGYSY